MENTENLPVSVNYAAGLCGLLAAITLFSVVTSVNNGKVVHAAISLVLGLVFLVLMVGLRRGSRAARAGAIILGAPIGLLGLAVTFSEGWPGVLFMVPGLLLVALLLVPAGARRYFTAAMRRASA